MYKRIFTVLVAVFLLVMFSASAWAQPNVSGTAAVLIDAKTGRVLYQKNAHKKWEPASTTKILSVLIALEKGNLNDIVTISKNAMDVEGTVVWLRAGEKQPLENLLYAMMLNSANDASIAVAEHVGGSVAGFVKMMNEKAEELGLKNSHFSNPHGLTAPDHYSTAYDMAIIAREAMKNPKFREIVATTTRAWHGKDWDSKLVNLNRLLSTYPGATGVKTGYTSSSGDCIVASAARDDESYIAVVFGSKDKKTMWQDAEALLDYGFDNFSYVSLVTAGEEIADVTVGDGQNPQDLKLVAEEGFSYLIGGQDTVLPQRKLVLEKTALPINKGDVLGYIAFMLKGEEVGRVTVQADQNVARPTTWIDWWLRFTWVVAGLFVLRLFIRFLQKRRKRRNIYASYRSRNFRHMR